ncbi:MAG: thiamine-phosphate synthase family protein [Methanomicrobium sp.]|nr:thiamine-phosphate synthase family protein [Methanomicrobium sp.]
MVDEEKQKVIEKLSFAVKKLKDFMPVSFIPDAGMNIAFAISDARVPLEVAGIKGGIIRNCDNFSPAGEIKFGAAGNFAGIVLTAMKFDPAIRCAANIRFSEEIIQKADDLLFEVRCFDRNKEPLGVGTMDWGVAFCCEENDVPDIIYDCGSAGKEPMIRILGEDPLTVVNNIIMIAERIIIKTNR